MCDLDLNIFGTVLTLAVMLMTVVGCTPQPAEAPRQLHLSQRWELQRGDVVAGHQVVSGLGDINIALQGDAVYAPFDGQVQPYKGDCVIFASEEVPSYLLRLCGLHQPNLGSKRAGEAIGKGDELQLAVLNEQADGQWALVEPSKRILAKVLQRP